MPKTITFFNSQEPIALTQKQESAAASVIQETESAKAYEIQMAKLLEEHAKQLAQLFEIASANLFKQQTQSLVSGKNTGKNIGLFDATQQPAISSVKNTRKL